MWPRLAPGDGHEHFDEEDPVGDFDDEEEEELEGEQDYRPYELPLEAARLLVGYALDHPDRREATLEPYVGPAPPKAPFKPRWRFW